MQLNVSEYIKESIKLKGGIDVKKSTAEKLKTLEKNGVQINLLLAGILDGLDYKNMFLEMGISKHGEQVNNGNSMSGKLDE